MRILIACESSGTVREAFRALGHDAWSCDLLPADDGSKFHIQGNCLEQLYNGWDMLVAHPPCTYLTNSAEWAYKDGPFHQKPKPETLVGKARRDARELALGFFKECLNAPIERICIENPVGAASRIRKPDQIIQPWMFGHNVSKKTCLWLKNLPPLVPTEIIEPKIVNGLQRWGNQTPNGSDKRGPSADRWKARSKTYEGVALAMAKQWGTNL
jgi:hypothetical protein